MPDPPASDRLFLALYPDAAQRDAIAEIQAELAGDRSLGRRPRWVPPRQAHATLVFLGDVPRERHDDVVAATRRAAARRAPFRWRFEGLGGFPSPRRPRVLWLGVAEGAEEARALHDAVIAELADAGLASPDRRPFSPHLTLARLRDRRAGPVPSRPVRTPTATVEAVAVVCSELGADGAAHRLLARLPLGGAGNAEAPGDGPDA